MYKKPLQSVGCKGFPFCPEAAMSYFQGLIMGLAYVAPIGLQNLFVIQTAMTQKRGRSYLTALVVIFFDVTLAFACFFGIGMLLERFQWLQTAVLLIGSLIVLWIGLGLLRAGKRLDASAGQTLSWRGVISAACVVTWCNPQAILDGTMMLGAFRVTLPPQESAAFILGVASASCLWFLALTTVIQLFSARINDKVLRVINMICGCVILFYGGKLLWNFLHMVLFN